MTSAPEVNRSGAKAPGRLSKALIGLFMRPATVTAIEDIGDHFRLVTLEGPALRGVAWTPGQKVQVAMGSAFVARTYTPIAWDAAAGRTRIVGYAHGDGPGSEWLLGLKVGDGCDLFGPRNSLDLRRLTGPLVLFGDETSIGLGHALSRKDPARSVACHFEIDDLASARQVLATLDLENVAILKRSDDDAHLVQIEASFAALAGSGPAFVLTGKAASVQRLRHELKRQNVPSHRIVTKAYWATGKAGMD